MLNPWLILSVVIGWVASLGAAGWFAYGAGQNKCEAEAARDERVTRIASEAAAASAAEAISRIEVKHTTVRQTLQKEIHEKPVFRDCRSGPDAVRLFNSAIPGAPAGSSPDPGKLPTSDAAR